MSTRAPVLALSAVAALAAGCGSSSSTDKPPATSYPAGATTVGAPGTARPCPLHRGLRISVVAMTCPAAAAVADAMGPTSAKAKFSVRGFACLRPPSGPVRCTRGKAAFVLAGGD